MGLRCIFPTKNLIEITNFWALELAAVNCLILGFVGIMLQNLLNISLQN
jgi:hypothetical protein